jgi:ribosomal protein S18 acetylase RimI-like enzyme
MFSIVEIGKDRRGDLKPLWQALFDHQRALTPHLREREVPLDQSWEARSRIETGWLESEPDSFVLAAEGEHGSLLGYAFVRVRSGADFASSWSVSDPFAEIATLVVLPGSRSEGVGSTLLDAAEAKLAAEGVGDMVIGVITTNLDAIRLYESRGAVPFVTEFLQRVGERPSPARAGRPGS